MPYTHIILGNSVLYERMAQINKFSAFCVAPVIHYLCGSLVVTLYRLCGALVIIQRRHQFAGQLGILNGVGHGDLLRFRCRHRHYALFNWSTPDGLAVICNKCLCRRFKIMAPSLQQYTKFRALWNPPDSLGPKPAFSIARWVCFRFLLLPQTHEAA